MAVIRKMLRPLILAIAVSSLSVSAWTWAEGDDHEGEDHHDEEYRIIPDVEEASQVNNNTIGLVFSADELFNEAINDLDREVDAHANIRLVPVLGKNDVQNVFDLLYLRGVDGAVFRADALEYVKRRGNFPTVGNVVNAMVAIHRDKILVIGNKEINSFPDLDGKKVAVGAYASGEFITGTVLSDLYDITIEPVHASIDESLELLSNGEVAAMVFLLTSEAERLSSRLDAPALNALRDFEAEGVHIVSLPGNSDIQAVYQPATIRSADLPNLIEDGEEVDTFGVDTVLGAYRWRRNNPRYAKTARFVDAFIESIHHLNTGKYKDFWGELDITAPVHGMLSLGVVSDVLAERQAAKEAELAAMKEREENAKEAERLAKLAALNVQREQILRLLDEKITSADNADALQKLLDQVNSFADRLE